MRSKPCKSGTLGNSVRKGANYRNIARLELPPAKDSAF